MSLMDKARAAWGAKVPDWVLALAQECDDTSLRKASAKLDISPAMASLAINKKRENLELIRGRVESRLMISIVGCPVLGMIGKDKCLREQAAEFSSANPLRVQVYCACRNGCKHYKGVHNEYLGRS